MENPITEYLNKREEEFKQSYFLGSNLLTTKVIEFNSETIQTALKMQAKMIEKEILEFQRNGEPHSFEELYEEALSIIEKYKNSVEN